MQKAPPHKIQGGRIMAALSNSRLFASPGMDSRIRSANTQKSEMWLGYFAGPCFVYMVYYAVAGTDLTQFYTDVLGLSGLFLTLILNAMYSPTVI